MTSRPGDAPRGKAVRRGAGVALGLVLAQLAYVDFVSEGAFPRAVLEQAGKEPGAPGAWQTGRDPVEQQLSAAAGDGNVFVRFVGFDPKVPEHEAFVVRTYFWGTYALYPRRLLAGEPGRVVNDGKALMASPFQPGADWLASNHVRSVVTYEARADGRIGASVRAVP